MDHLLKAALREHQFTWTNFFGSLLVTWGFFENSWLNWNPSGLTDDSVVFICFCELLGAKNTQHFAPPSTCSKRWPGLPEPAWTWIRLLLLFVYYGIIWYILFIPAFMSCILSLLDFGACWNASKTNRLFLALKRPPESDKASRSHRSTVQNPRVFAQVCHLEKFTNKLKFSTSSIF